MSKKKKNGFQYKLFAIVSESRPEIIGWNADGASFSIRNRERLTGEILGRYFKHANFDSFLRQLGFYAFRRLENHSEGTTFQNPSFLHGRPDLLKNIRRRTYADEGLREDVKKLQTEVAELRTGLHDLSTVVMQMQRQMAQMSTALNSRIAGRPTVTAINQSPRAPANAAAATLMPEGTAVAMSSPIYYAQSFDQSLDFGSNAFGSVQFGSIDPAASGAMIPDDEPAEHLLPMGTAMFTTGSSFGASTGGASSAISVTEEPAQKMLRRQEPVGQPTRPAPWQNSFGAEKTDDSGSWSFRTI